ncbi:MAG: hypothetical protein WCE87_00250, partial [Candidatus Udaeobacter sp.]
MSDLLPHSRPPARRRRGLWILLGLVVIALVVVVAGFFFGRRQIGEFSARKLGERLLEDGVFISWKSADWVPGGGVELRGLALYRDAARHDRLALLGLVTARRAEWLRWDKMNFKAADTQLLLGSGEGETKLEHMDMLLGIQPEKADLRECHARLQGLRIEAKCAFVAAAHAGNAEAVAASRQAAQSEGLFRNVNLDWLKSVKEWLKFHPEKDEPVLRMDAHSLPDRGMDLTMTFDGTRFQWRGQQWDSMQVAVKIPVGRENSLIDIDHVRIGHGGREAEIAGAFDSASRVIRISKFDSGIDVLALARAMTPDAVGSLSAASTSGAWRVSGTGEIPMDHAANFRWNGDMALDGDLVYASGQTNVALQKPTFSVRVEEQVVTISDLKAGLWDGSLDVARLQVPLASKEKKLRFEAQLKLDGVRLQSIINIFGEARKQPGVVPLDWKGAWRISGAGEIPMDRPANFRWNGDMALDGDLVYASGQTNIALQKPTFSVRVEEKAVTISDLKAALWDGSLDVARLKVHLPSKEKKLRIETQLTLNGARSSSVRKSFSAGQKQPRVVRLNWNGAWRGSAAGEIPVDHP